MSHPNSKSLLATLFILAFIFRISRILPNLEFVTTAMVISTAFLSPKKSILFTLVIMALTDAVLGNTSIFIFTWTGFTLPILIISQIPPAPRRFGELRSIFKFTGLGLVSNLFFYLWTNFGVWVLDSWGMYPQTLSGLVQCYLNGLPFLKTQFLSTLLFIPLTLMVIKLITLLIPQHRLSNGSILDLEL